MTSESNDNMDQGPRLEIEITDPMLSAAFTIHEGVPERKPAGAAVIVAILNHLIHTNQLKIVMPQPTRRPQPGSFNSQVLELNPGESVSKVRAVDNTMSVQRLPEEMPALRQQVRNSVAPAVARAKEINGGQYAVEVGDVVMPSGSLYVVAVVTRTE